jgi:phosphatidylglycerol---prolipoprotein diacylglyceryl transferase
MTAPPATAIHLWGGVSLPIHTLFEMLAYALGFRLFLMLRRRIGDPLETFDRVSVVAAAIAGAGIGSKLMVWLQHPDLLQGSGIGALLTGKSVLGALLGGLVLVEWVKRAMGIRRPTGDLYVLPLCLGIALGRIGCFLNGLQDGTYGTASALPWAVDFGDGIRRHPVQLYEIAFLTPVAVWAARRLRRGLSDGSVFRGFLIAYLSFRVALDFIKPEPRPYLGFTGTQIAGLAGLAYLASVAIRERALSGAPLSAPAAGEAPRGR